MQGKELVIVLDGGSVNNQLLTRKIREFGIYSELYATTTSSETIKSLKPKAIVISGDSMSEQTATFDSDIFSLNIPVLALNSSANLLIQQAGGSVERIDSNEQSEFNIRTSDETN